MYLKQWSRTNFQWNPSHTLHNKSKTVMCQHLNQKLDSLLGHTGVDPGVSQVYFNNFPPPKKNRNINHHIFSLLPPSSWDPQNNTVFLLHSNIIHWLISSFSQVSKNQHQATPSVANNLCINTLDLNSYPALPMFPSVQSSSIASNWNAASEAAIIAAVRAQVSNSVIGFNLESWFFFVYLDNDLPSLVSTDPKQMAYK